MVGVGRRNLAASLEEIKDYVFYQIGALQAFAAAGGARLQHVKPHGALYNMAVENPAIWEAVAEAVAAVDTRLILFVMAGRDRGHLAAIGARHGLRIAYEFFGDRAYNSDGSLVSRREPGAVIHDEKAVADKILKMVREGRVICKDGSEIKMTADTVCVHGDNPSALSLIRKIRETLQTAGVEIAPPETFLE